MFIIAEIGQAHEGSLGIAHSYIDALSGTGVDAIKFQTHIALSESSEYEPFRVKFSYEDNTRYDYWKRMEFTAEQWAGLKKHCEDNGLEFLSSPFSNAAVDLLEKINVTKYKIGSGEVNNYLMLEKIARTEKPIILSSGMSSLVELDAAIQFLKPFKNQISILQCTTAYPTVPGQWGLKIIPELIKRYKIPVGFSDHSGQIHPCIAAVALGAVLVEFHVVFNKLMFGPDAKASVTIEEAKQLVAAIRDIDTDRRISIKKEIDDRLLDLKMIFEKSLAINRKMKAGDIITFEDLEAKKPKGFGLNANSYKSVIGRKLRNDLEAFSFLNEENLF
jgi:N-acetylneuraminate synthase